MQIPTAATAHRLAAVVSPRTTFPCLMIVPAPRKPMPVATCAATRLGSEPARKLTEARV